MYKKEIRVIGIDDSPFRKFVKKDILVVGTIFRGGSWLDGLLSTKVRIDGNNGTKKLIEMINKSKFKVQLRAILLDGIALGGFNIIDILKLYEKTKIPVIVVVRRMPDIETIKRTLVKIRQAKKIKLIEKAGEVKKINNIYIQFRGLSLQMAKEILNITCTRSYIPEPIRAAHLIASGIVTGESRGKA